MSLPIFLEVYGEIRILDKFSIEGFYNVGSYFKIKQYLTEDEFIYELKRCIDDGNRIEAATFRGKTISIKLTLYFKRTDEHISIIDIPAEVYLKIINTISIDSRILNMILLDNMEIIKLYNILPDEERLRIEINE